MATSIQLKKLKRIMYKCLRWRLQIPNYVPHNPLPDRHDPSLTEFSRGVMCAYADLLDEMDKIEEAENQRHVWRTDKKEDSYIDEMRWGSRNG